MTSLLQYVSQLLTKKFDGLSASVYISIDLAHKNPDKDQVAVTIKILIKTSQKKYHEISTAIKTIIVPLLIITTNKQKQWIES